MTDPTPDAQAWNTYAQQQPDRRAVNAAGERTWFNWTQYPDHGPGAEVLGELGPNSRVLDLGCGTGGNLAHLAGLGAHAVGVDLAAGPLAVAGERWAADGLALHQEDALSFLDAQPVARFDAVYSVFGAVWFTDPSRMLPAVHRVLRPGGVLGFSQRPPVAGCFGPQAASIERGPHEDPHTIRRWDHTADDWCDLLRRAGFRAADGRIVDAPPGRRTVGTLLVVAER